MARKTMWEHFVAVASNGSRCDGAMRDDGQRVPGGKEASVAVARRFQSFKVDRQPWPLFVKPRNSETVKPAVRRTPLFVVLGSLSFHPRSHRNNDILTLFVVEVFDAKLHFVFLDVELSLFAHGQ